MLSFINRNLSLLAVSVCLMMSCASLIVATAALVGFALATDKALSTLPMAVQYIATMLTSIPAAYLMHKLGRKLTFMLGSLFAITGAGLACFAIIQQHFWLFVLATALVGAFQGFANYIRYAAAETVAIPDRSKAISFVMLGGVAAAVIGPNLAKYSREWVSGAEFAGSYAAAVLLYLMILFVMAFLRLKKDIPEPVSINEDKPLGRPLSVIVMQPRYLVAVLSGMIGYGVMSFIMTATPLAMNQSSFLFDDTSLVIQWHVLAMFAPSFVTGTLIVRFGLSKVMLCGVFFGFACVLINMLGSSLWHYMLALICLGISWNFLFVGSTTMITDTYNEAEKNKAQAVNDFLMFSMVAFASLSAGALQNAFGWQVVNLGVLPLLTLVLIALLSQLRKDKLLAKQNLLQETPLAG